MALNVRIDPAAHARLAEVARAQHIPLTEALSRAIETYRREQLIQQMSADYDAVHADPEALAAEEHERALWDNTTLDGLESEPPYPPEKTAPRPGKPKRSGGSKKKSGRARR